MKCIFLNNASIPSPCRHEMSKGALLSAGFQVHREIVRDCLLHTGHLIYRFCARDVRHASSESLARLSS